MVAAGGDRGVTYAGVGVDISAGDAAVERIREHVASTVRPGVLGGLGGFGGLFAIDTDRYRRPVLVASTDGVGTKLEVARATARYGTVGIDLVAMCVDDLVCVGAEPLFLLDYVAAGAVDPGRMAELVAGVAEGCRRAGCALLGGETAEHPGVMAPDGLDLAGFAVGVVERGDELGSARVRPGDLLVGLPSPGLRSNGYTLARHVLLERAGLPLDGPAWDGAGHTLADELLAPSVIYTPAVLAALAAGADPQAGADARAGAGADPQARAGSGAGAGLHACAHITGGGIPGNLVRVLPGDCDAVVERGSWATPRVFGEIARLGPVDPDEMLAVFNLGIGMVLVVDPACLDAVLAAVDRTLGGASTVVGRVTAGTGAVRIR